ncbi:pyridoxal kinase [Vibrio breoganii]|uniref:pyridoxal kinase n=2 Tax=Vibrio TaxID=662 RepID=A0AAN1CTQ9_9VIBR|nr:pyridoxal kinase [Vibrio breoganii]ANO34594.1 pyridoxal kinase [Vibrio breoganii]OCH74290.1 pyridoxal kinase [Vibrio breoganii]OED84205.1 pyridoxal kinase [Vibrio breoganii ZF-55]PMG78299.1 pyridoxal kinase [Vibrio breoganii]PMK44365.1 pyridoxal kinase [Vibrio breoganii]
MTNIISIQPQVVYGHVGNSSAVFPMQRMGVEVLQLDTLQLAKIPRTDDDWSGYKSVECGIGSLIQGIDNIHELEHCGALISGYLDNAQQVEELYHSVAKLKKRNRSALYICHAAMYQSNGTQVTPDEVKDALIADLIPIADVVVANKYELSAITATPLTDQESVINACEHILDLGARYVIVRDLDLMSGINETMMMVTHRNSVKTQWPKFHFAEPIIGVGDLISAVFAGSVVNGVNPMSAFSHTCNAVYGILKITEEHDSYELQTVAGQYEFVEPTYELPITKIEHVNTH